MTKHHNFNHTQVNKLNCAGGVGEFGALVHSFQTAANYLTFISDKVTFRRSFQKAAN